MGIERRFAAGGDGGGGGAVDAQAARFGLKALTLQPELSGDLLTLGSGVAVYQLLYAPVAMELTKCWVWVRAAGVTSGGSNTMALYSAAGAKLAETGDMTGGFTSADTFTSGTLSAAVPLAAGDGFYIGALTHFSTGPSVVGALQGGAGGTASPAGGFNGRHNSVFATAQASFPFSITPASLTKNSGGYCMGVS